MPNFDQLYNKALSAAASQSVKGGYVRLGQAVYHLNAAAMKKWAAAHYFPPLLSKIAKPAFVGYQGEWHKYPVNHLTGESRLSGDIDSKEMRIIHYEAIDANDKSANEIRALLESKRTEKKNDMRHYKAMLAESKKVGWPSAYEGDLTKHDKRELTYRSPDLPVGWILRDSGTHLVMPEKLSDGRAPGVAYYRMMKQSFGTENCRFYAWDGTVLQSMRPEAWVDWIDRKHRFLTGASKD